MLIDAEFKESINPFGNWRAAACLARKKSGVRYSGRRCSKMLLPLLRRRNSRPVRTMPKLLLRPIHEIPAEITDQADMRRKANFKAAAHLAQRLRLTICMTNRLDNVESFSGFSKAPVDLLLATAKDCAASAKNVRRKARTVKRIAQCERAQHSADHVALRDECYSQRCCR